MNDLTRRQFLADIGAASAAVLAATGTACAQRGAPGGALGFSTAVDLARMLRDGEVGSVELTEYFIARIERFDESLNAVVVRDFDRALEAARAADAALARGDVLGRLHGLPMTIKESYNIAGLPTTWGIPENENNIADTDAVVVARLKAAGAHFMGKTNVPFGLADAQSYNDIYGTTNNPWDVGRTPGGSSGGTAATLAAGLTGLDFGSDIGGSIRNPAHFCGIYGHKPTWGIVPLRGHALDDAVTEPDLPVVGPLARSADDLALALDVVVGPDTLAAPGWRLNLPAPRARSLADMRVAVWATDELAPVDRPVGDRIQAIADRLAGLGATVSDSARPTFDVGTVHESYTTLLGAAMAGPNVALDLGSFRNHNELRTRTRLQWQAFFEDWDVLLAPIWVTTAFPHNQLPQPQRTLMVNGAEQPYFASLFWAGLAIYGSLPSTVFPTGLADDGLPIGVQAMGAEYADRTTIEFARLMADEWGGYLPPPGFDD